MFTKADFKNGEMAALIQIGEAARRCSGSYIIEAPVTIVFIKKANIARIMNSTQPEL